MEDTVQQLKLIIDTDVHNDIAKREDLLPFLPKAWHRQWLEQGIGVFDRWWSSVGRNRRDSVPPQGGNPGTDPQFVLKDHVERNQISYVILTATPTIEAISVHVDPDYANAIASAYNLWLEENWLKVSPKFKGSILVNASDPPEAVKEIERWANHPGMVQVILCTGAKMLYGQKFYHPIYEAAEAFGLPVAIHPGGSGVNYPSTPAGFQTRYFEMHNTIPLVFISHVNSLICEGVFEKYTKLKFVAIEGGISWLPHLMWRMDKNYKGLRSETPWLKKLPSEYVKEHIRFTSQPIEEPPDKRYLLELFEMCHAEDVMMYSSDYPHWDYDPPSVWSFLPKNVKDKIMYQNALELYRII